MNARLADAVIVRGTQILLFLIPVSLLSVRNGVSICAVLLAIASVGSLVGGDRRIRFDRGDLALVVAMAAPFLASLITMVALRDLSLSALDGPSRFLLAIPIYLALRDSRFCISKPLDYALPLGVAAGLVTSVLAPAKYWEQQGTYFVDPANFGAAMLVLGCLCLASIDWTRRDPAALRALKLAGFAIGLACAIRSTQRGVWIAIPILLILWMRSRLSLRRQFAVLVGLALSSAAAYLAFPEVPMRVSETRMELSRIVGGDMSTSAGERLQMWRAALSIIMENPIFGVGPSGVAAALRAYGGWSSPGALAYALSQIHNEVLGHTLRSGIFGFASILAIYLVPFALAARRSVSQNRFRSMCSTMTMLVVAGYATVGLTIEVFNIKMFATFYALMIAILLGASRQSEASAGAADNARLDHHGASLEMRK